MSRLKDFANFANRVYKKLSGSEKETSTPITPEKISDPMDPIKDSYGKMGLILAESQNKTGKSRKSTLLDAIATIRTDFQIYNGAKNQIRTHNGGIKEEYIGNEMKSMKVQAGKITTQLDDNGWKKYFEMPYQQAWEAIDQNQSMPQEVRKNLKELCKEYCFDFQNFESDLKSGAFKLPEDNNSITTPSFQ
ncbi:hypothetical protein [Legionella parisiensis]|uniref:Uncharacterized protein n=1 Tax=Legionella parisiensis TaxID=45071 RepID=A0A1E5JPR0_9GAMM|nr:hypothetical protein [Legionella parisiensis]KTD40971.1 hypothetical protein Lpar_2288 [Legionella parisiensis]OEH46512.1 hypothetical protein lpari_02528 [Legionella parisiensis]STX76737.1 Uncharacterised protein [Legionella parisiensis]